MGEEDDTVDGGAADMRGPVGSGCERGRRVRERGRRAGPAHGPCARWEDGKGLAGRLGWLAVVGRAGRGGLRGLHPFSSFSILFIISSLLFEFEFGSKI